MIDAYGLVKWLHVLAATALIGPLVVLPAWSRLARARAPEGFATYAASLLRHVESAFVLPALAVLFVTGLAMAVGPLAEVAPFAREGRWILVGLGLWVVLAAAIGLATGILRHLVGARRGRLRGHEAHLGRDLRLASWSALAVAVVVEGVMVFQMPLG